MRSAKRSNDPVKEIHADMECRSQRDFGQNGYSLGTAQHTDSHRFEHDANRPGSCVAEVLCCQLCESVIGHKQIRAENLSPSESTEFAGMKPVFERRRAKSAAGLQAVILQTYPHPSKHSMPVTLCFPSDRDGYVKLTKCFEQVHSPKLIQMDQRASIQNANTALRHDGLKFPQSRRECPPPESQPHSGLRKRESIPSRRFVAAARSRASAPSQKAKPCGVRVIHPVVQQSCAEHTCQMHSFQPQFL